MRQSRGLLVALCLLAGTSNTAVADYATAFKTAVTELVQSGELPPNVGVQTSTAVGVQASGGTTFGPNGSATITIFVATIVAVYGEEALCSKAAIKDIIQHEIDHIVRRNNGTSAPPGAGPCEEAEVKLNDLTRICQTLADLCPCTPVDVETLCAMYEDASNWLENNKEALLAGCGAVYGAADPCPNCP